MGIPHLLPNLKDITELKHIRSYAGLRVGIDALGWMHRGLYTCLRELMNNEPCDHYVHFFMSQLKLCQDHNLDITVVFDGAPLPAKYSTYQDRAQDRIKAMEQAKVLKEGGDHEGAFSKAKRALCIQNEHVQRVIQKLREENVKFLVAPFEADAQLAFMTRINLLDAVITEDADYLAYGCPRVLFKLDKDGYCSEIRRKNLGANAEQGKNFCFTR